MKNGKCPMCSSTKVYSNPETEFTGSPDEVETNAVELYDVNNDFHIYLTSYICVECGFIAMFAHDLDEIKDIPDMDGWKRVK